MSRLAIGAALGLAAAFLCLGQAPQGASPKKKGGFGPNIQPASEEGFQPIFDGQSSKGWDGDPNFWRVEGGVLIGETAADKQPAQNTFMIWRGGAPADFELKLDYKLLGHNSGIQIRSSELPDIKFAMKGYQADMDAEQMWTGQFYEERGRGFLALRGQFNRIEPGGKAVQISSLGDREALKAIIKSGDWNSVHLIARGHTLIQMINGQVTSMLMDLDPAGRAGGGLIGLQVHRGPAMRVEFRNIRLKYL
jgi:hypothetical protein